MICRVFEGLRVQRAEEFLYATIITIPFQDGRQNSQFKIAVRNQSCLGLNLNDKKLWNESKCCIPV